MNELIKRLMKAAIAAISEKALNEHRECLDHAISDLVDNGGTPQEVGEAAWLNGYYHGLKENSKE